MKTCVLRGLAVLLLLRLLASESSAAAENSPVVPEIAAQGRSLAPQAVSCVNVSPDGKWITVGTMGFSHEPNVWLLSPDGKIVEQRHLPPWAPMQVATLVGGQVSAVGMPLSRFTPAEAHVWSGTTAALFRDPLKDEFDQADSLEGQFARWREGSGEWRTGWLASSLGELFVHGPDWLYQPPNLWVMANGARTRLRYENHDQLPNHRASRMAASADGQRLAFGWLTMREAVPPLPQEKSLLTVWSVQPNRQLWAVAPTPNLSVDPLPDPAADFPELRAAGFRLGADKVVPGSIATAVAISEDGGRVAVLEYGVQSWVRTAPVIGKWDPPIHAVNFVPKAAGRLRVFDGAGRELLSMPLPEVGRYELGFNGSGDRLWCWPASWFARGMAGEAWLPVDAAASRLYRLDLDNAADRSGARAPHPVSLAVPGGIAVADAAVNPTTGALLVSSWDGNAYLLAKEDAPMAQTLGGPARVAWSADGSFAVAGTNKGQVRRLNRNGGLDWSIDLPVAPVPVPEKPPEEVVPGVPVYQGGRVPGGEFAYVGDIWVVKLGASAVLVDAGGTSGFPTSQGRVKALGIEKVTHVLQTHSHGDHSGGAYLWRAAGAQIVAPRSAAIALTWLMPMLSDYGVYPPRPVDLALPLAHPGDETDFQVAGQKFHALFLPGHSFDLTVYTTELNGRRIAFTGDLGFETNIDIVHRCWGDAEKARPLLAALKAKLLPWKPDVVFTGHGVRKQGTLWLEDLLRRTEDNLNSTAPAQ